LWKHINNILHCTFTLINYATLVIKLTGHWNLTLPIWVEFLLLLWYFSSFLSPWNSVACEIIRDLNELVYSKKILFERLTDWIFGIFCSIGESNYKLVLRKIIVFLLYINSSDAAVHNLINAFKLPISHYNFCYCIIDQSPIIFKKSVQLLHCNF